MIARAPSGLPLPNWSLLNRYRLATGERIRTAAGGSRVRCATCPCDVTEHSDNTSCPGKTFRWDDQYTVDLRALGSYEDRCGTGLSCDDCDEMGGTRTFTYSGKALQLGTLFVFFDGPEVVTACVPAWDRHTYKFEIRFPCDTQFDVRFKVRIQSNCPSFNTENSFEKEVTHITDARGWTGTLDRDGTAICSVAPADAEVL